MNLQEIIDHGMTYDVIPLPLGEYEGPFYVRKPCTLVGNVTTLWNRQGPALIIESTGVALANLRLENLEGQAQIGNDLALLSRHQDTACQNVEIIGRVQGIKGEEGLWQYPHVLSLGHFPANQTTTFDLEIVVPVAVTLTTTITGLHLSPEHLEPGRHVLSLTFDACRHGTFFYGEITLHSQLVHTIYINALANEAVTKLPPQKVYTPEQGTNQIDALSQSLVLSSALTFPDEDYVTPARPVLNDHKTAEPLAHTESLGPETVILQRGERRVLLAEMEQDLQFSLTYTERSEHLDIDPYIVMLDQQGKAQRDEDLIFFGNVRSQCGSVTYQEAAKKMQLSLASVPASVERLAIVYAVYGDNAGDNFSKLSEIALQLKIAERELWRFPIIDLTTERTIVAAEIYRYRGQWKLNAIGAGYREGLERLLRDYGLEIME